MVTVTLVSSLISYSKTNCLQKLFFILGPTFTHIKYGMYVTISEIYGTIFKAICLLINKCDKVFVIIPTYIEMHENTYTCTEMKD